MNEHEAQLPAFVRKDKRARLRTLFESKRGRAKVLQALPHFDDWADTAVVEIPASAQTTAEVVRLLQEKGAPARAWVISAEPSLDSREYPLGSAIALVLGASPGSVVSCVPGKLAYFEGENRGDRCLLVG